MKTRAPTPKEIEELVAFLPRFETKGFIPIKKWGGGTKNSDGVLTMPWPEYDELVETFFQRASSECWSDPDYVPQEAGKMLQDDDVVRTADVDQIKTMLTFCVRGERFCDGHWASMIESGSLCRLLNRLRDLQS